MKKRFIIMTCLFISSLGFKTIAQNFKNYNYGDEGFLDAIIYKIDQDSNGNYWFCSWVTNQNQYGNTHTLAKFDGTNFINYDVNDGIAGNEVWSFIIDNSDNLWLATNAGLTMFDGSNWITYTVDDGLIANSIKSVLQDNNGDIWVGSGEGSNWGVSKFDGTNWTSYTNVAYNNITEDNLGNIWTSGFNSNGINNYGVSKFDGTNWTHYYADDGLFDLSSFVIYSDDTNNIWVGYWDNNAGLNKFDGTNWTVYTVDDGLASNKVRAITQDIDGVLWFGGSGTFTYDGINFTSETIIDDALPSNFIRSIYQDNNGDMWFGHFNGVTKYEANQEPNLTLVPDDNFEQELINLGLDNVLDDYVITSKIDSYMSLSLNNTSITNWEGIEDFKALQTFNCNGCGLQDINFLNQNDFIKNSNLDNNNLENISLNQFTYINNLELSNTLINHLDLSQNTFLNSLIMINNSQLESIDLRNGNNENLGLLLANNFNLSCVFVDDASYFGGNWTIINGTLMENNAECVLTINDQLLKQRINVFPNPVKNKLIINNESGLQINNITITDILGQVILQPSLINNSINMIDLTKGVYFVDLETINNKHVLYKVIKE